MTQKTDEEIDQIVDTLVGDHDVADKLKAKLHDALPASEDPEMVRDIKAVQPVADSLDTDDDLWENMPV